MNTLPILDGGFRPSRVVVDNEGTGVPASTAYSEFGVVPHVIFMRNDGWSLGAPIEFEAVAYEMWDDAWTHFAYLDTGKWLPIDQYVK